MFYTLNTAKRNFAILAVLSLFFFLTPCFLAAQNIVRGVNFVHPMWFSKAAQDTQLNKLKLAGIKIIRFGLVEDVDKNIDFIKRAYAQHISTVLIFHGKYAPNAPTRPYRQKEFPGMFAGPPISCLDTELSRQYFREVMHKLDSNGIVLAGMELENEINMAGNNPDFQLPGEGRVLSLDNLYHDPEGQQIAKGYLQYLKVLAVLKKVRDNSKLNQYVPLLPTSLVDIVQEGPWPSPKNYDGVSTGATMAFFRANGLDQLVDAYNVHTYPWADGPGEKVSAIHRQRRLQALVQSLYSSSGPVNRKPLWITEWGFTNTSKACPPDEKARGMLVQEMMGDFAELAREGLLKGLIYYSWIGEAPFDVYRCGGLTETGKIAIKSF